MNRLRASVRKIETFEGVSLVECAMEGERLTMLGLELPEGVVEGAELELGVKATHLTISRTLPEGLSLCNRLPVTVERVEYGKLLASLRLRCGETPLEALLPRRALEAAAPGEGDRLYCLFQASELSVLRVLG
jgi:ABC-type molybdate transport system ATPase subunit